MIGLLKLVEQWTYPSTYKIVIILQMLQVKTRTKTYIHVLDFVLEAYWKLPLAFEIG
jgi:hypothetical protein